MANNTSKSSAAPAAPAAFPMPPLPPLPPAAPGANASASSEASGYKTMSIGIGKSRQELHDSFVALSDKLGCRPADLIWDAISKMVANPPKTAPVGATAAVGSAPGFWVAPIMGDNGAKGMEIIEVASRTQASGRTFLRYKEVEGDAEKTASNRKRAEKQARRAAEYDCELAGIDASKIKTRSLVTA